MKGGMKMRKSMRVLLVATTLAIFAVGAPVWGAQVQKVTIVMNEFNFVPDKITLKSGMPVEMTLANKGRIPHEFMLHAMPQHGMQMPMHEMHEWYEENSYFKGIKVTATAGQGVKIKRHGTMLVEIVLQPGKSTTLKFTPKKKGTFEFACHLPGHYEAGQKGTLIVR